MLPLLPLLHCAQVNDLSTMFWPKHNVLTKAQCLNQSQRPYAMLKAPVPSITVVKQHWAQSVLGWVTAYKRVNHTKDWLALLLARCWSHREEGIKKHMPSAWRVALWDPSVGSGPNLAGSVWPAGNNGHASLRDAWEQTNKQQCLNQSTMSWPKHNVTLIDLIDSLLPAMLLFCPPGSTTKFIVLFST
jgi:hypothetical protein